MSKTRREIFAQIDANNKTIKELQQANIELDRESILMSDEEQWFTEKMETFNMKEGRKKIQVEKLIGRVHWNEDFKDEGTGEVITIERSSIVRVDGSWDW